MGIHINGYPEIHPRMAWIYGVDQVDSYQSEIGADQRSAPTTSRETVEGGVGPVAGVSAAWMPRPSPR